MVKKRKISIHVPLAGDDAAAGDCGGAGVTFLSTSPLRGTTFNSIVSPHHIGISIHVPLAGDDGGQLIQRGPGPRISIHVPLAGDDAKMWADPRRQRRISIHVPLAGDDLRRILAPAGGVKFLSTSPLRGTTQEGFYLSFPPFHFYPRPPCGGRHKLVRQVVGRWVFLSTSPLRGTTWCYDQLELKNIIFLSTSPLRGTTQ